MTHLFTIDNTIWDSVDRETVFKTAEALHQMKLFRFPFPTFDVQVHLNEKATQVYFEDNLHDSSIKTFTFRFITTNDNMNEYTYHVKLDKRFLSREEIEYHCAIYGKSFEEAESMVRGLGYLSMNTVTLLVVLLATKNADKVTEAVKKHGPKSRKRPRAYDYVTTIKIGKITETMRSDGGGQSSVRPHLRRGHIRNQRVGKGLEEVKPIFISPVFVNAEEGWINNQRKEYRIAA
jgi:hypothetical protein